VAIKWRTKVNVLSIERKNVSVTLEQIDDTDAENVKVLKTFSILDALVDTPERRQQVLDELERQYNEEKQNVDAKASIVGTLAEDIIVAAASWEDK